MTYIAGELIWLEDKQTMTECKKRGFHEVNSNSLMSWYGCFLDFIKRICCIFSKHNYFKRYSGNTVVI